MPSIEAEMKTHAATDFLYIFLNISQNDFYGAADREQISKGVETWAQKSNDFADEVSRSAVQKGASARPSRFKAFDPTDAKINEKNILTDFEDGCSQDLSGSAIESALDYNQCKQNVQGQTIDEIRHIIKDIYEQKHGLKVNVVMKQNTSLFSISNKMQNFSWYEGVLPWYSLDQVERKTPSETSDDEFDMPFLEYITAPEKCETEFERLSVGRSPCYRDFNNTPHILIPFLADNYAWPKGKTSAEIDRAFGHSCDPSKSDDDLNVRVCLEKMNKRVQDFSKYMIGSDICFYAENVDDTSVDTSRTRACYASFCTEKLPHRLVQHRGMH